MHELRECIWHLRPESVGKGKLDTICRNGVLGGPRAQSGELDVLTRKIALKAGSFNRKPEQEARNRGEIWRGTPSDTIPVRRGIEVTSRF